MEAINIISAYRTASDSKELSDLEKFFSFKSSKTKEELDFDENLEFRTEITETLLNDFSLKDIYLIRRLFRAELDCEEAIWRHDNLYQLSFYLYSLGQFEDTFLLYEAKYGLLHMDSSTMQDRYSITVGHEVNEVIEYVQSRFKTSPDLKVAYPELLNELQGIINEPDYDSISDYTLFIRGYFYGHENIAAKTGDISNIPKKSWWKFW